VHATVVILTKLPGHLPVKTRLVGLLGEQGARQAYVAMLEETVSLARRIDPDPGLAYSPPDADPEGALPSLSGCRFCPVQGDDGAACLENALADAYVGYPLIALGGDAPDLPVERLRAGVEACSGGTADAVLVPTPDGGFSSLALRRPVEGLARGFRYGGDDSLTSLCTFFEQRGLRVELTEPWPDVDTPDDYEAYLRRRREQ